MPQRRTSIKDMRVARRRHMRNLDIKTDLKKTVKKFRSALAQKNIEEAQNTLKAVYKKFDKTVKVKIMHKNTVARRKSYFTKLLLGISKK